MQDSPGLEAFADAFSEANQATGVEAMLAIYALEGTTENTKNLLKNAILYELGLPIQSINFEPLTGLPEESIEYTHQDVDYVATLEPSMRMRVSSSGFRHCISVPSTRQNNSPASRAARTNHLAS